MVGWSFSPFWAKESIKLINARYETLKNRLKILNDVEFLQMDGLSEKPKKTIILQMKNTFFGGSTINLILQKKRKGH